MSRSVAFIAHQAFSLTNFRGTLIQEIVGRGGIVFALAPDFDAASFALVQALGAVPVYYALERTGKNPLADLLNMLRLARVLRRLNPDVVLSYSTKPVIYGTLAAWLAGVSHRCAMIEGLGYAFTPTEALHTLGSRSLRLIVSLLFKFALARAHQVIVLNVDDLNELLSRQLVDRSKVTLLDGIGLDIEYWQPTRPFEETKTFMLAARLLREKGICEYVEAARRVKQQFPKARFLLLGGLDINPGALTQTELEAWVNEGIVEWPGHVDVKPWLEETSVFVLPSYREGLPRSTQEAMAMERAVITTDVPGCRETVIDGVNGYLVPARDVNAIVEAMLKFLVDPTLAVRMGRESRHIAEERFDVRRINSQLLSILNLTNCAES